MLPTDHLVDTAYLDSELLVTSQETYGVDLMGSTRVDTGWQACQAEAVSKPRTLLGTRERQQATCPAGKTSQCWLPAKDTRGNDTIHIRFSKKDCSVCPLQSQCTRSQPPRRTFTVRPQLQQLALEAARAREKTEAFKKQDAYRAGIEGTVSLSVRTFDLRRACNLGLAKTHLQHILVACAINLTRLARLIQGVVPFQAHASAFTCLFRAAPASLMGSLTRSSIGYRSTGAGNPGVIRASARPGERRLECRWEGLAGQSP